MSDQRINYGGPAFPQLPLARETPPDADESGMSLRDWFASQSLAGILATHVSTATESGGHGIRHQWDIRTREDCCIVAEGAYRIADAMLKARGS
jgi:hypothetical protein